MKEELIQFHKEKLTALTVALKAWQEIDKCSVSDAERVKCITEHHRLIKFHRGAVEWLEN